jgi:hypothetical protein
MQRMTEGKLRHLCFKLQDFFFCRPIGVTPPEIAEQPDERRTALGRLFECARDFCQHLVWNTLAAKNSQLILKRWPAKSAISEYRQNTLVCLRGVQE